MILTASPALGSKSRGPPGWLRLIAENGTTAVVPWAMYPWDSELVD